MTVRKLSPTGDFLFGGSGADFISNTPDTVAQVVQTSLLLWLGEWYIDTSLGMPWIQGVLGKHAQALADSAVQDYIVNVQGVTGIDSFTSVSTPDIRKYAASVRINTLYGPTDVEIANRVLF